MEHKSNDSRKIMFNVVAHLIENFFLVNHFSINCSKIKTLLYNVISVKKKKKNRYTLDILFNYHDFPKNRLQHTVDFNITSKTYILLFLLFVAVVVFLHEKQNLQQLSIYTSKWYIIKNCTI